MHRTRNAAYGQPYRGFESLPLRQPNKINHLASSLATLATVISDSLLIEGVPWRLSVLSKAAQGAPLERRWKVQPSLCDAKVILVIVAQRDGLSTTQFVGQVAD